MERIKYLINKLNEAQHAKGQRNIIEIDLMLDYTRVLYADLLEWRGRLLHQEQPPAEPAFSMPAAPAPVAQPSNTVVAEAQQPEAAPTQPEPIAMPVMPAVADHTAVKEPITESFPYSTRQSFTTPGTAQTSASDTPADLKQLVGLNDKFQFISDLFKGNTQAFHEAMEHLNHLPDFNAAEQWVGNNLIQQYDWKEEDPAVENFYSVLKRRFSVI